MKATRRSVGLNLGPMPGTTAVRGARMVMRPLLRVQDALLRCAAMIICVVGGWRSGKTRGAALKFYANCLANPWTEAYGEDRPFSIVIGLTWKVLTDSAYRELKMLIPRDAIAKETKGESWEIHLRNGHVIKFRTAKGAIEGASCCGVWLDEAHLLPDAEQFENYQMRASDALGRRFLVLVSGLPETGWLQDTFDRPEHHADPNRAIFFCSTYENIYNPPHVIPQFRASVSKRQAISRLEGRWMPRDRAIYYEWNPTPYPKGNLWDYAGDRKAPCHLGVDIGDLGAVLWFQEVRRRCKRLDGSIYEAIGLHVVDEFLPENFSGGVLAVMREVKQRGWIIHPDHSRIFVDPTTRPDEYNNIREVFGNEVGIVQAPRGDKEESVEYGHDCVNAALCDADGNVRLTCYSGLPRQERSLLTVITRYHRGPTGRPVRDNKVDHVLDAWRYPVAHILPLEMGFARAA